METNLQFEKILGYRIPTGTFPCWVISEEEMHNCLYKNEAYRDYSPSCYFKLIKRLDNNFIQGYLGHTTNEGRFHEGIANSYTYFDDYQKRKPVYLSFDRVTFYRMIEILPTRPLTFMLKRVDNPIVLKKNKAFMIMPFHDKKLNDFYIRNIKQFLKDEMQIDVLRADDFNGNDIIIDTIYKQIEDSEFIIADTSHPNKNVFYEFGYASAKEKEIITIQNIDVEQNLFFDRAHIRAIFYSNKDISNFQHQLKNTLIAIREKIKSKG